MNSNGRKYEKLHELLSLNLIEEFKTVRSQVIPCALYKYRTLNDYTLECLVYSSTWICKMDDLNDPFEGIEKFDTDQYQKIFFENPEFKSEFKSWHLIEIEDDELNYIRNSQLPYSAYYEICKKKGISIKNPEEQRKFSSATWDKLHTSRRSKFRSTSFSERKDSILMWSHYADNHNGICIEYDLRDFKGVSDNLYPVKYSDDIYDMTPSSVHKMSIEKNGMLPAITKANDWNYEQEWRIVFPVEDKAKEDNGHLLLPKPIAIYLGARFYNNPDDKILLLNKIAKERNIPIIRMRLHSDQYKIIPMLSGGNT